jgi:hypothetical protein
MVCTIDADVITVFHLECSLVDYLAANSNKPLSNERGSVTARTSQ